MPYKLFSMPDWIADLSQINPMTWAFDAVRPIPTASPDPLALRGFSPSASSTDRREYACVVLSCEKPRLASVSVASLRDPRLILTGWAAALPKLGIVVVAMAAFDALCLWGASRTFRKSLG